MSVVEMELKFDDFLDEAVNGLSGDEIEILVIYIKGRLNGVSE